MIKPGICLLIFVSTIIACITQPMTIGAVSIIGFTIMILVGIVDTKLPFKASVIVVFGLLQWPFSFQEDL